MIYHSIRVMTDLEKVWLACAFDAEGYFGFGRGYNRNRTGYIQHPIIGIINTSMKFLNHVNSITT